MGERDAPLGPSLNQVAYYLNGYPTKPEEIGNTGLPIIRIEQVKDPSSRTDFIASPVPARCRLRDGDLILSWSGSIGAWMWTGGDAVLNQHLFRVIPYSGVESRYLLWALREAIPRLEQGMQGSAMTHITQKVLSETRIRLPTKAEQLRIAAFLDREIARVDDAIEVKQKTLDLLAQRTDSVIMEVLTGKRAQKRQATGVPWLGDIPAHWSLVAVRHLLDKREEDNNPVQTTTMLSVEARRGVILFSERGAAGNKPSEDLSQYQVVRKGDIVANRLNFAIGSVGVAPEDGCISQEYLVLSGKNGVAFTPYYGLLFRSPAFLLWLARLGKGIMALRERVYYADLRLELMPCPPLAEQMQLAKAVGDTVARQEHLMSLARKSMTLLHERRRALISAAVAGRLQIPKQAAEVAA